MDFFVDANFNQELSGILTAAVVGIGVRANSDTVSSN